MKKNEEIKSDPILPDLKHASMEYSASSDGDDQLSISEDEEINSEELSLIDIDKYEAEASLKAALVDSESDADNFIIQSSDPDEFDEDKKDDTAV